MTWSAWRRFPETSTTFHPGSHVKQGVEVGITYIAEMLNEILKPELHTTVLLETMAGKGSEVGRSFEELREILTELNFLIRWVYVWIPVMYGMPDMTS